MLGARNWTILEQKPQHNVTKEEIHTKASWC